MKGYKLDRTLYIFDATPDAIPVSVDDVDVIYVQQELLAAYVNANQEAASKIKPYNYKLIAVNKLPWADYVDNDLVEESTEYTVSVKYGPTISIGSFHGLPFDPRIPYSAAEGTQLVFTLPSVSSWMTWREGNNDSEYVIQVQVPESIQDSYEIVWPSVDEEDPENPVDVDGSLSFIMPAEDVTLNIDLVENPDYQEPQVDPQLTVVNELPNNYRLEVKYLYDQENPETIDDISSTVNLPHDSEIYVYVYDENNNLVNISPTDSADYYTSHADAQAMVDYHAYCTIEADESDTVALESYMIYNTTDAASVFGAGENFILGGIINIIVEVPTVNS